VSEAMKRMNAPVRLEFVASAGRALSRFLAGITEGRLLGQRCPSCAKVYVPPRGACPKCGVATEEEVEVRDTGTVTTFCIVNVPYEGQSMKLPYVYASILLDGADIPFAHVVLGIEAAEVRMGLRVKAEWVSPAELKPTMESIRCFRPTGEPDVPFDSYKEHL
jgi:uncharacterized OB-fold protein